MCSAGCESSLSWAADNCSERGLQGQKHEHGASSVTRLHSKNGCRVVPPLGLQLLYEHFLPTLSTCLLHPKWDSAVAEMETYSFFWLQCNEKGSKGNRSISPSPESPKIVSVWIWGRLLLEPMLGSRMSTAWSWNAADCMQMCYQS